MAPRRRGERPLCRRAPQIDERARFVIFCEGELTEPLYLKAFASLQEIRSVATLDIRGMACEPRKLVEEARAAKRSERRQSTGVTKYWCVFDVEAPTRHARLNEAVQMARDNGISVAISNPCFELWLVLHYTDHESWIDNDDCGSLRRRQDSSQGKSAVAERNGRPATHRPGALPQDPTKSSRDRIVAREQRSQRAATLSWSCLKPARR